MDRLQVTSISQLPDPAPGPPSFEAQLLEGCVGVAPSLATMHDDVDVLPRSASSPSGAAPVLATSGPVLANFEHQNFRFGPSLAASFNISPPATSPFGANQNFLSQSYPIHFEAEDDDWESLSLTPVLTGIHVTTSVSKTSSDMKLMLYERKTNYLILSRIACVLSHSIVARTQLFLCCS